MAAHTLDSFCCRFLNRASLKAEGDIGSDGSIAKPWSLCTVQHVEDLKSLIRIFPLWSSSIFLSIPIAIQGSLTILQALSMDRHLGQHFKIPAGSVAVIVLISTSIFLTLIDRFLCPMWQKLTRKPLSALQRIGVGHVLNVLGMAVSALVESKRLNRVHTHHLRSQPSSIVPMSALWLFPQLVLVGVGEAFHFPGQVALYYQEFPASLRSTATAMIAMIIGIAYYLSTAIIDLLRKVTSWLPDNINNGRLDTVYWTLTVVGMLNFGYFLACARLYKYQNAEKEVNDSSA
ncbi:protein NRT1/ PTR FAMILY 2.7-like [Herrania umbratica]|uniref:Protein NRT1/ PTR FAMILY 2.7-like n=1 Tax=Herrania umbratica TaxID=108875 RepID=A0A6J0ZUU3_9ROSI|nr:protein NRT1/ PTR FAMILY 2.7-like [Herrania umbratica]